MLNAFMYEGFSRKYSGVHRAQTLPLLLPLRVSPLLLVLLLLLLLLCKRT
jgi:hypothetical protein